MKEKQIKIIPPDGYEIDRENSTCDVIKFKPIKETLTYNTIMDKLFEGNYIMVYIANDGYVYRGPIEGKYRKNGAISKKQLQRILAINQLYNIARYYNGNWKPDRLSDYTECFVIWKIKDEYKAIGVYCHTSYGMPEFKNRKVAQEVIDNPNFRDILDTIFK